MSKQVVVFILLIVPVLAVYSQNTSSSTRTYMQNQYLLERMSNPEMLVTGASVQTLPPAPPDVIGDDMLNTHFQKTTFLLNDSSLLEGLPVKYYIARNEFDIKTKTGLRALKGDRVKSFVWIDSATKKPQVFINGQLFKHEDGTQGTGFFQLISEGKVGLIKQTEVIFKEANYHVALNVGSLDHKLIKKIHYYALYNNNVFKPLPKKKFEMMFPDHRPEIQRFIKINTLDLTREDHLQALFDYYNSLK
ncbi:MAG: hypothetical protein HRU69_08145 [Flammeovirgaceae bacterium]|nr:MAG: hypothetical protein HRU69_08145 [Flammeovirgaceae bacterium]